MYVHVDITILYIYIYMFSPFNKAIMFSVIADKIRPIFLLRRFHEVQDWTSSGHPGQGRSILCWAEAFKNT